MPDVAKRLAGPVATTASAVTVYTVPASTTTIIRSIHVANTHSTSTGAFTLSINANAAATQLFGAYPIPGTAVLDWSGFIVLNAGDTIQLLSNGTNLTFTMSGVEVTA